MIEKQTYINWRRELHQIAELSGKETQTAQFIQEKLQQFQPDKLIPAIGGDGILAIFKGKQPGQRKTLLRAELDGLPITEKNQFSYVSQTNASHLCGHDGHMTIMLRAAEQVATSREQLQGEVAFIFQPAEETGEGAQRVLDDPKFDFHPNQAFAFHNLPRFPLGQVVVKEGVFASASRGIIIRLHGSTSHAAHPENGISPLHALQSLINSLVTLPAFHVPFHRSALVTIVSARLGEVVAFGTSPGFGEIMATLRCHHEEDIEIMSQAILEQIAQVAKAYHLEHEVEWVEIFSPTSSTKESNQLVREATGELNYDLHEMANPMPWSEDFGRFSKAFRGAFFGVGSGIKQPQLHQQTFDFPDELIVPVSDLFVRIVEKIHSKK